MNVVDAPTGAGKTTVMIEHLINEYNGFKINNKRFIVMLPFLSEIDRIKRDFGCAVEVFDPIGRKTEDILTLIKQGNNIVTTHSCFIQACFNIAQEVTKSGFKYALFCDEEPPVFNGIYPVFDTPIIKKKYEGDLELLQMYLKVTLREWLGIK